MLFKSIQQFALSQGYGIVLQNANTDRKAYIRCMRSNKPNFTRRPPVIGLKSRIRGSFKTDCPFRVYLFRNKASNGQWEIRVQNAEHNHNADDPITFHQARKLTDDQIKEIRSLSDGLVPPGRIYQIIRKKAPPTQPIISRDIYNALALIRRPKVAPSKPLQAYEEAPPTCSGCRGIGHTIGQCGKPPNQKNEIAPSKPLQTCKKAPPTCSDCGGIGHTIRQCGKPPNQKKQKR